MRNERSRVLDAGDGDGDGGFKSLLIAFNRDSRVLGNARRAEDRSIRSTTRFVTTYNETDTRSDTDSHSTSDYRRDAEGDREYRASVQSVGFDFKRRNRKHVPFLSVRVIVLSRERHPRDRSPDETFSSTRTTIPSKKTKETKRGALESVCATNGHRLFIKTDF